MKVHCRVGSLEKLGVLVLASLMIHCRVGSLETRDIHR